MVKFAMPEGGHATMRDDDDHLIFDTDAYPLQFAPSSEEIINNSFSITFPDLLKGDAYGYARGGSGSLYRESCNSFITLVSQEWGPSGLIPAPQYNYTSLSDTVVGTVPEDSDIILVKMKVTRTTTPSQINGTTIPTSIKQGEWVVVAGNSIIMEYLPPLARMVSFKLADASNGDGTRNVIMQRRQSVMTSLYAYWRSGNDPINSGWTWGNPNSVTVPESGHIVSQIEAKDRIRPVAVFSSYRGGSDGCSLTDSTNFQSVYTGQIAIIPGKTNVTPSTERSLFFSGQFYTASTASSHTYSNIPLGKPASDRFVVVPVYAFAGGSGAINSVTFNGSAATLLFTRNLVIGGVQTVTISYYGRLMTTGTTLTVVANYNVNHTRSEILVFSLYGLNSNSAYATGSQVSGGSNVVTTSSLAGGIGIGVAVGGTLANIITPTTNFNSLNFNPNIYDQGNFLGRMRRAFGMTTGTSSTMTTMSTGSPNVATLVTFY